MSHAPLRPSDPIHTAVERHRVAYQDWQDASEEGEATYKANAEYGSATASLLTTPCVSRFGAQALQKHLRWWLAIEAEFAAAIQPTYAIAEARLADLTLFLGREVPEIIPTPLPVIELPPAHRALNLRRASRRLRLAGEITAALAIVAGGIVLTGFATML